VSKDVGSPLVGSYANPEFIQEYTIAVIHEVIRMFPLVPRLSKSVTVDTSVKAKIFDNHSFEVLREVDVPIPAGGEVVFDFRGLHMNRTFTHEFF